MYAFYHVLQVAWLALLNSSRSEATPATSSKSQNSTFLTVSWTTVGTSESRAWMRANYRLPTLLVGEKILTQRKNYNSTAVISCFLLSMREIPLLVRVVSVIMVYKHLVYRAYQVHVHVSIYMWGTPAESFLRGAPLHTCLFTSCGKAWPYWVCRVCINT